MIKKTPNGQISLKTENKPLPLRYGEAVFLYPKSERTDIMALDLGTIWQLCRAKNDIKNIRMEIQKIKDNADYAAALIRCERSLSIVLSNAEKVKSTK